MALPSEIKQKIKELMDIIKISFASSTNIDTNDHENSMLKTEQRIVAWELVHKTQAYYQQKMVAFGGVDKVLENLEEYIVQQIDYASNAYNNNNNNNNISPGKLAQSNPINRQDISDTDIGRYHTCLRALLDKSVPNANQHRYAWPNHLYKGSTSSYDSSQKGTYFRISLRELLAYYWLAASDEEMPIAANFADEAKDDLSRKTLIENSKTIFISTLAGIAREHNRDHADYQLGKDRSSCVDGIFGRLTTCSSCYNAVTTNPFDAIPAIIQEFIVDKIIALAPEQQAKIFNYIDANLSFEDVAAENIDFVKTFFQSLSSPASIEELLQYLATKVKGFNSLKQLPDLQRAQIESCIVSMLQIEQVNLNFNGVLNTDFLQEILSKTQPHAEYLHFKEASRETYRQHFSVLLTNLAILKELQKTVDRTLILKTLSQHYAEDIFPERNRHYISSVEKCLQEIQVATEQLLKLGFNYQGMTDTLQKLSGNQLNTVIQKVVGYFDEKESEVVTNNNNQRRSRQVINYKRAREEALTVAQSIMDLLRNNNLTDFYNRHLWLTTMIDTTQESKWVNFIISIARERDVMHTLRHQDNKNKLFELINYLKTDSSINFEKIATEIKEFYKTVMATRELQELNTSESFAIIKEIFQEKLNILIELNDQDADQDFISYKAIEERLGNLDSIFNTTDISISRSQENRHQVSSYDALVNFLLDLLPKESFSTQTNNNNQTINDRFYNSVLLVFLKNLNMHKIRKEDADTIKWLCDYYLRFNKQKSKRELPFYVEECKEPRQMVSALVQHLSVLTTTLTARLAHVEQSPLNQLFNAGLLTLSSTEHATIKLEEAAANRGETCLYMLRLSNSQPSYCVISRKENKDALAKHRLFDIKTFNIDGRPSVSSFNCDFILPTPQDAQKKISMTFICYESISQLQDAIKSIWNKGTMEAALGTNIICEQDELLKKEKSKGFNVAGYLEPENKDDKSESLTSQQQPPVPAIYIQPPGLQLGFFPPEQSQNQQTSGQEVQGSLKFTN